MGLLNKESYRKNIKFLIETSDNFNKIWIRCSPEQPPKPHTLLLFNYRFYLKQLSQIILIIEFKILFTPVNILLYLTGIIHFILTVHYSPTDINTKYTHHTHQYLHVTSETFNNSVISYQQFNIYLLITFQFTSHKIF